LGADILEITKNFLLDAQS